MKILLETVVALPSSTLLISELLVSREELIIQKASSANRHWKLEEARKGQGFTMQEISLTSAKILATSLGCKS